MASIRISTPAKAGCSWSANTSTPSRSRTIRRSSSVAKCGSRIGAWTRGRTGRFERSLPPPARPPATISNALNAMTWKRICEAAEVPENAVKQFDVDGILLVVVNYGEGFRGIPRRGPLRVDLHQASVGLGSADAGKAGRDGTAAQDLRDQAGKRSPAGERGKRTDLRIRSRR